MTGRERLVAAVRGGNPDRTPILEWPSPDAPSGDALIVSEPDAVVQSDDRAVLVEVANPYGQALARDLDPYDAVEELVEATRALLNDALEAGADGVFYVLSGADTPGYRDAYLAHDRALLAEIAEARLNVLYVVGPALESVDGVSAHLFAWDATATGLSSSRVRAFREGAQASSDPLSEVRLIDLPPALV